LYPPGGRALFGFSCGCSSWTVPLTEQENEILILGGGLTGLSAGCILAKTGLRVAVFERDSAVGGVSKTIEHHGFRFDLGGHRFFTKDPRINTFVKDLMGDELIKVPRKSKIFMRGKYFDYPLRPVNAMFGMGIPTTVRILIDYGLEQIKRLFQRPEPVSLEDWVVANFGRTMYTIYFKEYSEKVWGIECSRISAEWMAQRISGLSLSKAIANAFFRTRGKDIPSLVDEFFYPRLGIGRISERLSEEIQKSGKVFTHTDVERINHSGFTVDSIMVRDGEHAHLVRGSEFISSIPITKLINALDPPPPENVMLAASQLKFRDIIIVAIMIDRKQVTDQTWIYIPEKDIPFGRIHEPTNWSRDMAPDGKTLLVVEFFSFQGDAIWRADDAELTDIAVRNLEKLGYIQKREVTDSAVRRVPKAYPLFDIGYIKHFDAVYSYLSQFRNLHVAGRVGMFKYYNMDHAIDSGMTAAEKILKRNIMKQRNR
jgi:protoporphyrinogen oxidase